MLKKIYVSSAQYPIEMLSDLNQWKQKINTWVKQAASARSTSSSEHLIIFPEYAAMELTSLFDETERSLLTTQAQKLKDFEVEFIQLFQKLSMEHQALIVAPSWPYVNKEGVSVNRVFVFSHSGRIDFQDKHFMTRFEDEEWGIQSPEKRVVKIFQTKHLKFSINICFDVEFAWPAQVAALHGAQILAAPSCTETIKGANRVHIGARARALENQIYVVVAQTVGEAKWSPAVDLNYGFAGFYSTPDVGFPDDGIVKQGEHNVPCWVHQELNLSHLEKVRTHGAVFNFKNHKNFLMELKNSTHVELMHAETVNLD